MWVFGDLEISFSFGGGMGSGRFAGKDLEPVESMILEESVEDFDHFKVIVNLPL